VAADNPLHAREPYTVPLEFALGVQPLKGAEQLSGILHIKASSIIADEDDRLPFFLARSEFDARVRLFSGEFPGLASEACGFYIEALPLRSVCDTAEAEGAMLFKVTASPSTHVVTLAFVENHDTFTE
jgi:hypothetical protein